jgi:monofunctional biosynthetic peptidoglycan transglycosylase
LEKHTSKQKILETYLNIIEYGKGLYGIEQASRYYFKKSAASLTARESAFLAMLLPSPIKYAKSFKNKSLTPFARRIVDSVLLKMRNAGNISEEEYNTQLESRFSWEIAPVVDDSAISEEELEDIE